MPCSAAAHYPNPPEDRRAYPWPASMKNYNLAFLGFGNVGQALARLLLRKRDELHTRYNLTFTVTGIATGRHGMAIDPHGIDLEHALAILPAGGSLDELSALPGPPSHERFHCILRSQRDVRVHPRQLHHRSTGRGLPAGCIRTRHARGFRQQRAGGACVSRIDCPGACQRGEIFLRSQP